MPDDDLIAELENLVEQKKIKTEACLRLMLRAQANVLRRVKRLEDIDRRWQIAAMFATAILGGGVVSLFK